MFLALALAGNAAGFTQEVLFRSLACGALHMGISSNTRSARERRRTFGVRRRTHERRQTNLCVGTNGE